MNQQIFKGCSPGSCCASQKLGRWIKGRISEQKEPEYLDLSDASSKKAQCHNSYVSTSSSLFTPSSYMPVHVINLSLVCQSQVCLDILFFLAN